MFFKFSHRFKRRHLEEKHRDRLLWRCNASYIYFFFEGWCWTNFSAQHAGLEPWKQQIASLLCRIMRLHVSSELCKRDLQENAKMPGKQMITIYNIGSMKDFEPSIFHHFCPLISSNTFLCFTTWPFWCEVQLDRNINCAPTLHIIIKLF